MPSVLQDNPEPIKAEHHISTSNAALQKTGTFLFQGLGVVGSSLVKFVGLCDSSYIASRSTAYLRYALIRFV